MGGNEAEWQNRKRRIATKLRSLNPAWQIIPWPEGLDTSKLTLHAVAEIPTANGPADHGYFGDDKFLGSTEAKKVRQMKKLTPSRLARAWTHSRPARSGCTFSLHEIRLACSHLARLAGQIVPPGPRRQTSGEVVGTNLIRA